MLLNQLLLLLPLLLLKINYLTLVIQSKKLTIAKQKITDHDHDEYITSSEFNKLTAEDFAARLAQADLASENDIAALVKKTGFDDKLKYLSKKVTSKNQKIEQLKMNLKNYKHFIQVFLLINTTFLMMEHKFT